MYSWWKFRCAIVVLILFSSWMVKCQYEDAQLDIILLLDDSDSIKDDQFEQFMKAVLEITATFKISASQTNLAVVSFSATAKIIQKFTGDVEEFKSSINDLKSNREKQNTATDEGLRMIRDELLKTDKRKEVPNVLILFTDGCTNTKGRNESEKIAQELRDNLKMLVFVVHVGREECVDKSSPNAHQLNLVGKNNTGRRIHVNNFDQLSGKIFEQIQKEVELSYCQHDELCYFEEDEKKSCVGVWMKKPDQPSTCIEPKLIPPICTVDHDKNTCEEHCKKYASNWTNNCNDVCQDPNSAWCTACRRCSITTTTSTTSTSTSTSIAFTSGQSSSKETSGSSTTIFQRATNATADPAGKVMKNGNDKEDGKGKSSLVWILVGVGIGALLLLMMLLILALIIVRRRRKRRRIAVMKKKAQEKDSKSRGSKSVVVSKRTEKGSRLRTVSMKTKTAVAQRADKTVAPSVLSTASKKGDGTRYQEIPSGETATRGKARTAPLAMSGLSDRKGRSASVGVSIRTESKFKSGKTLPPWKPRETVGGKMSRSKPISTK